MSGNDSLLDDDALHPPSDCFSQATHCTDTEKSSGGTLSRELDATPELEEVVIDFLSQLCRAGIDPPSCIHDDSSESDERQSLNKPSIRLEIADRTRTDSITG